MNLKMNKIKCFLSESSYNSVRVIITIFYSKQVDVFITEKSHK